MRNILLGLSRIRSFPAFFNAGSRVSKTVRAVPTTLFFAVATTNTPPASEAGHAYDALAPNLSFFESKLDLRVQDMSWRDIPKVVSESMYDLPDQTRGIIKRRLQSDGGTATMCITAVNFAVYILWKLAPTGFMVRHFANSLESIRRARVWTTVTSNFSHMGILHLASNMYLLNRFGNEVAEILGPARFYVFYGAAGVASALASLTFRRMTNSSVLSLGASGAVVATLWLYACFFPDRRMSILGSESTLSMQELVLAYTMIDAAGLLGSLGKIDFAAHLGGAVFGNSWFYLVREKLVQEQATKKMEENRRIWRGLAGIDGPHHGNPSDEK